MHEVLQPKIGKSAPQRVFGEISYSVDNMPNYLRKEWEAIKKYDVVFLVGFGDQDNGRLYCKENHVKKVRGCEVIGHFDEEKNKIDVM